MKKNDRLLNFVIASTDTVKELLAIYLVVVLLTTIGFMATEMLAFGDALWLTFVTATTTGYGDMFPKTPQGRMVAVFIMHVSTFIIIPLVTARMASKLIVNSDAFTHDEQELMKNTLLEMREYMIVRKAEPGYNDALEQETT